MESKPTGQKRHLILVPGTKGNHTAPSSTSRRGSRAQHRVVPKPAEAGSSARRRTEMLKESIRRYDPGSSTFYGLEKANGQRWKGLRDIPPRPPGQSQWEASGEDGQNSIENPMVPKAVIRK
jgi:hypothetical protein